MSQNNGDEQAPSVDGYIEGGGMQGGHTISLEIQGAPDDTLDDVYERWVTLKDELLEDLEDGTLSEGDR